MARPIWKGSISFGLVSIPVQLETAVREKSVHFHLLSKDGTCRLHRKLYCPENNKTFEFSDTARGIQVSDDRYVVVDEKEIEAARPERSRTIEIEQFVDLAEIDPVYFNMPYFVTPTENSAKPYKLLYEAMDESKRIGLARFVMRDRQYLSALRVMGDGLVLHTMHYKDEVLSLDDSLPDALSRVKNSTKEVQFARQLIETMTKPLDLSDYKDEYRERLEALIEQKRKGKKTVELSDDHDDEPLPRTIDLMDALKRSLRAGKPGGARVAARHPRRKSA